MNYIEPAAARAMDGLRLALTAHTPAPYSMSARAILDHHGVAYVPVLQIRGGTAGHPRRGLDEGSVCAAVPRTLRATTDASIFAARPAESTTSDAEMASAIHGSPSLSR